MTDTIDKLKQQAQKMASTARYHFVFSDGSVYEKDAASIVQKTTQQMAALAAEGCAEALDVLAQQRLDNPERLAYDSLTRPFIERDSRRQKGTKKQRGSRWPEIDAFIEKKLQQKEKATAKELWAALCREYLYSDSLCVDGGADGFNENAKISRIPDEGERPLKTKLSFSGFQKRLTKIRTQKKAR